MQKSSLPKWLHSAMLLVAVALIVFGVLAWSNEYRIQSMTLFSFGALLAYQWYALRSRTA